MIVCCLLVTEMSPVDTKERSMEEELVKLVTLNSEEKFSTEECPQVSLDQLSRQEAEGDHCLLARLVSLDTEHITRESFRVSENRLRRLKARNKSPVGEQYQARGARSSSQVGDSAVFFLVFKNGNKSEILQLIR